MNTHEVIRSVDRLMIALQEEVLLNELQFTVALCESLMSGSMVFDETTSSIARTRPSDEELRKHVTNHIADGHSRVYNWDTRLMFRQLESISNGLREFQVHLRSGEYAGDLKWLSVLEARVEDFAQTYSQWLRLRDYGTLTLVALRGTILWSAVGAALSALTLVKLAVSQELRALDTEYSSLELLFDSGDDSVLVSIKLDSLNYLYFSACSLFDISAARRPLRIERIESGSMWFRLFGDSKVVGLLVELIRDAAGFLYRTYTSEGRLSAMPHHVKELEAVLDLEAKMRSLGYDTEPVRRQNVQAAYRIATSLNQLLANEPQVSVNGEDFSFYANTERIFEAQRRFQIERNQSEPPLLLEEGDSDREPE